MFRIISLFILSLFCIFNGAPALADDGTLLAQYDLCWGYGMQLLYNDVNTDLVLLSVVPTHDPDTGDVTKTRLQAVLLQQGNDGKYAPSNELTVFDTPRQIKELDWTYDPVAKKYLIAFLHGEPYDDSTEIKFLLLGLSGSVSGNINTIPRTKFSIYKPQICIVPANTQKAPSQARFLFVGRGWIFAAKRYGIVSAFLDSAGKPLGSVAFSVEELSVDNKRPMHEPYDVIPSGDNKGFLIVCKRREHTQDVLKPTVVRIDGSGKYENHVTLSNEEPLYNSLSIHQVSNKKFAVAWADENTYRYWISIVRNDARKASSEKLVSEEPECSGDFQDPYTAFCRPDGMKRANLFFIGSESDKSVFRAQIKKNGKINGHDQTTPWANTGLEPFTYFYYWFVVAPIKGTSDMYCALVTRVSRSATIEIYGYAVSGN